MFSALYNSIIEWNRSTNERQKLQHAYLTIAVAVLLLAGLVSLIDSQSGQDLLNVSLFAGAIFIVNTLVWSLMDSLVITKLSNRRKR